jgi:glycosyltransferase involved in cell wall biosynthesis
MKQEWIALLGQKQALADGVVDYCTQLEQAMAKRDINLKKVWMPWQEKGWVQSLQWLWHQSQQWQNQWVIVQYTASAWSERALPIPFLLVLQLLKQRGVRLGVMFHEVQGFPGQRLNQRLRRSVQLWVLRNAIPLADKPILNVSLETLNWLPVQDPKVTFIPVGSNIPEPDLDNLNPNLSQEQAKTIAVFGMTSVEITSSEIIDIAHAVKQTAHKVPKLRLVTLGRGSKEAEIPLREALKGVKVEIEALGLLSTEEISEVLAASDVQLHVRGEISTRRGTVIAGMGCGLPIVAYTGKETGPPIPEAGVLLVPEGDREAVAQALTQVLTDEKLHLELRKRSLEAYRQYFSWDAIAQRFCQELTED